MGSHTKSYTSNNIIWIFGRRFSTIIGEQRGEVYVNARKSESEQDPTTGESIFCASERLLSGMLLPPVMLLYLIWKQLLNTG